MIVREAADAFALKDSADEVFVQEVAPDFQKATVAALGQQRFARVAGDSVNSVLGFLQALGDLSSLRLDVNYHGIRGRHDETPASGDKRLQILDPQPKRNLRSFPQPAGREGHSLHSTPIVANRILKKKISAEHRDPLT